MNNKQEYEKGYWSWTHILAGSMFPNAYAAARPEYE